jgi:hypothetical protein
MEKEYTVHIEEAKTNYISTYPNSQQGSLLVGGNFIESGTYHSPRIHYGSGSDLVNNNDNLAERVSALLNRVELVRSELAQLTSSVARLVNSIDETKHERRTLSINKDDSSTNK